MSSDLAGHLKFHRPARVSDEHLSAFHRPAHHQRSDPSGRATHLEAARLCNTIASRHHIAPFLYPSALRPHVLVLILSATVPHLKRRVLRRRRRYGLVCTFVDFSSRTTLNENAGRRQALRGGKETSWNHELPSVLSSHDHSSPFPDSLVLRE